MTQYQEPDSLTTEKHTIAGNITSQIIGRVVVLVMSLITIKLISNYVGTEGTGYYNTIITYLSFFIAIADFGLFSIAVREMSKNPQRRRALIDNIFIIRLVSAVIVTAIAISIAQLTHYPGIIKHGVLIAGIFLFFNLLASIFDMIFQAKLEMKKVAISEVISKIITLSALIFVVWAKLGFYWIIGTVSLSAIVMTISKYLQTPKNELPRLRYDKEIASKIIKLAVPFGLIFILNNFYFKVDTLILFYFKGPSDVGIYAVAYRVLETTMFAAAYLSYSLKPLLSANIEQNKEKAANAVTHGLVFLLSISFVIGVMTIPFSREIIIFLSNSTFVAGAPVIIVLAFASIIIYMNSLLNEVLIAKDARRYLLGMVVTVLTFNIVSNILLIPHYSFYAAAATTVASELLIFIFGYYKARKIIPFHFDLTRVSKLILSAIVSIIIALILKALGMYFILAMVISVGFYLVAIYSIDAVPKDMIRTYLISLKEKWIN